MKYKTTNRNQLELLLQVFDARSKHAIILVWYFSKSGHREFIPGYVSNFLFDIFHSRFETISNRASLSNNLVNSERSDIGDRIV